jgi:polysaccharide export outer membrane protein
MKINIYFLLFVVLFYSSCVTTADLEYISSNNQEISTSNSYSEEYRLKEGDLLSVQISTTSPQQHDFFNKEQTSNSQLMIQNPYLYGYLIKPDGFLDLPSFGKVKAEGFTLRELENIIKQIAISYFEKPVVKINIINFDITILGEVNSPGTFRIVDPTVNILYALSLAGDMTKFGNRKKVKIIRTDNNTQRVFYIDLSDEKVLENPSFMLHSHDIIYVAPLKKQFYAINDITKAVSLLMSAITIYLLINNK